MLRRLFACFLALTLALTNTLAMAQSLPDVLNNLTSGTVANVNQAGRFQSGARNSFTLGGAELRIPGGKNTPTLISFTPPKVEAGCGGVSAYFGGFSFIKGKEIENLLKNIGSGVALGFVAHLALKTLCPQCEAVVQLMQRLNQIASMSAKDWCRVTQAALAKAAGQGEKPNEQEKCGAAAETQSDKGGSEDYFSALNNGLCSSVSEMNKWLKENVQDKLKDYTAAGADPYRANRMASVDALKLGQGNETWVLSGVLFPADDEEETYAARILLLNMLGTTLMGVNTQVEGATPPGCSGMAGVDGSLSCLPTISAREMTDLFMCGVPGAAGGPLPPSLMSYCAKSVGWEGVSTDAAASGAGGAMKLTTSGKRQLYDCATEKKECMTMVLVDVKSHPAAVKWQGLYFQVNDLLTEAVRRVASNERLWDGSTGSGDIMGRKIVALIQSAPYPLYQAINVAAIYPAAAQDMLSSMAGLIAQDLAISYFNEIFRMHGRNPVSTAMPIERVARMRDAVESMSVRLGDLQRATATRIGIQEGLTQSIRTLNRAIQTQVMSEEVLGGNQFGKGLATLVTGSGPAK